MKMDEIKEASRDELAALWARQNKCPPPKGMSKIQMKRILSFDAQVKEHGGLDRQTTRKLKALAPIPNYKSAKSRTFSASLMVGSKVLRKWNGITHSVEVTECGFLYKGKTHRSLSAVAKQITGAHWSGPRFFGLTEK